MVENSTKSKWRVLSTKYRLVDGCQPESVSFEHMFESIKQPPKSQNAAQNNSDRVIMAGLDPSEFIYLGKRFHVYAINSRWSESGGWWNRISDGINHESDLINNLINDSGRSIWQVEAAPIGAVSTFEIELDELTKIWRVRPTSRPK